jgi:molecular chaperone GrpE
LGLFPQYVARQVLRAGKTSRTQHLRRKSFQTVKEIRMSAKRTVFPPQKNNAGVERDTGDASDGEFFSGEVAGSAQQSGAGHATRGRAAYASAGGSGHDGLSRQRPFPDEMPSYEPSRSYNPLGDFPDDAFSALQDDQAGEQSGAEDIPASLADEKSAERCRDRICPACPEKKEAAEERLRAAAELDNARKRLAREREEQLRFAAETVLSALIPSLDNLDLALQHANPDAACKNFVTGVRMTRKLMGDALAAQGLEQIGQVGEEFDPAVHEAVGMEDFPEVAAGCVGKLLTPGYKLHERLLRPARVLVCKRETGTGS